MNTPVVRNQLGAAILDTGLASLRTSEALAKPRAALAALSANLDADIPAESAALRRIFAASDALREAEKQFQRAQLELTGAMFALSDANPDWNAK